MSRYFGAAKEVRSPSDDELMAMIDVQERVELSPEQFDAVLYDKMESQKNAERKKASAMDLMKNMPGARLPPAVSAAMNKKPVSSEKKDYTGLLIGAGLALVAVLFFMRRKKKGPSQVTYAGSPKGMR